MVGCKCPSLMVIADYGFVGKTNRWLEILSRLNDIECQPNEVAIQVRVKDVPTKLALKLGQKAIARLTNANLVRMWNGDFESANALGFDGCHQPEQLLAPCTSNSNWFHSSSVHSIDAMKQAESHQVDFMVLGPVFSPSWKVVKPLGISYLESAVANATIPTLALGGITVDRIQAVKSTSVAGVAVLSAIMGAEDPVDAALEFLSAWHAND